MVKIAMLIITGLLLQGCGLGGMTRATQPVVDALDSAECRSSEIRDGVTCDNK